MKFKEYIRDKVGIICGYTVFIAVIGLFMKLFNVQPALVWIFVCLGAAILICSVLSDYLKRKAFYGRLLENMEKLDQKYLVCETLEKPSYYEAELMCDILRDCCRSMTENVKESRQQAADFRDFIELWVHETKLPLASLSLMLKGVDDGKVSAEINRLDSYIDQALYYARCENASQDYLFDDVKLKSVTKRVAMKNKDMLLAHRIEFHVHDVDVTVMTDAKWLEFMLNQIVSNSVKYTDDGGRIEIWAEDGDGSVQLHVRDNGIGIPGSDLPLVCGKSFTGQNGRRYAKSTGMGLYIVNSLCDKLGHRLNITSQEGEFTEVTIEFGVNEMYRV